MELTSGGTLAPGLVARAAALDLLFGVLDQRRSLDELAARHAGLAALAERDRAFALNLALTTLRNLGALDALIDGALERPMPAKAKAVRHVLRLALAQLVILGTPPHAAVDSAVRLAEARGLGPFKPLVNALLRRLAREGAERLAALDAARVSTPPWLWDNWSAAYGEAAARAIAEAHRRAPPLDLSVRADPGLWAERLGAALLPTGSLRLEPGTGRIEALPGYAEGAWWVQDAAAALPVRLFGPMAGTTVIDACAAPGGKTLQLAAAGAQVVALDRSASRVEPLRRNLARTGLAAEIIVGDVEHWTPAAPVGHVLLDAPCSGTGTLRRNPDIAWTKRPADVARLAATQARLLAAALGWLAPGGTLVYAVCSLEPAEGLEVVGRVLDTLPGVRRIPVRADEIGGLDEAITPAGDLRTLPSMLPDSGLDGFYAARLRRLP